MTKRIAVLNHPDEQFEQRDYLVKHLVRFWQASGWEVTYRSLLAAPVDADLASPRT